ncbi:MFS transporter [Budvicia aquatica]|uniref:4-hydroxybenzoate transporter PcaK n=1 Tax=Budvicia aquatica TaxID=82979 RepID=A0A484ZCD5_9GAMM|nr:MFS transporter [Budvicia aquatica]VFS45958.1 4-hydroxybenzoate transporter PcaK [Budvicia aquatica]
MSSQQRVDVCTFLDDRPVSLRQWLIIFLGFITLSVDGFDVTAMGFIAPALIDDWQVARHDLGPLMMSGLFGLAAGSMISGPLADRFGRKIVIVGSVAFFGLASLISAWAWDLHSLTVLRFITGIGLGAAMPNITTLIAEFAQSAVVHICRRPYTAVLIPEQHWAG